MSKAAAFKALKLAQNKLKKKYDNITTENDTTPLTIVSTGSAILDDASGVGGLATGRLYEIFG